MSCISRRPHRRAITLIELLVVIAIISVLVGLLLPAVQNVREAANRAKCQNNLKQISLAVLNYESARQVLPPSRLPGNSPSWAWLILPYLEQDNVFNQWNFAQVPLNKADPKAIAIGVPIYFCPSRRDPNGIAEAFRQSPTCGSENGAKGALGDYAASIGTTGDDLPTDVSANVQIPPNGAFEGLIGVPTKRISDGLSNTFLVGEKNVPLGGFGIYPLDCSIYDGHNPVCNTRSAGPGFPLADSMRDPGWKFGSFHPGICQFAFCDGSVHVLRSSTSETVLGLLANKADGQTIPDY